MRVNEQLFLFNGDLESKRGRALSLNYIIE